MFSFLHQEQECPPTFFSPSIWPSRENHLFGVVIQYSIGLRGQLCQIYLFWKMEKVFEPMAYGKEPENEFQSQMRREATKNL